MTKKELINEMYDVVNNNADVFQYADKWMINVYAEYIKTTKKATLEQYLAKLNAMVEEAKKVETVETEAENTENTVEVEKNDNNVEDMKFTEENKDILFKCIWGAFRYFSNMERREVGDYEFGQLVCDMYQTMCGEIETDSEWDEYWDIEESMVTHICEASGAKQINKEHPNEDGYDTIILPSA